MTKLPAIVLAALTLADCSDEESKNEPKQSAAASGVAPCPISGAVGETEPATSEELPNLADRCDGAYTCNDGKPSVKEDPPRWLRKKGSTCLFGNEGDVFHSDGRIERTNTFNGEINWGEWSGDDTTFHWHLGSYGETCTRIANQ